MCDWTGEFLDCVTSQLRGANVKRMVWGRSVREVVGHFTFKKIFGSKSDDWVDKLNHAYTVTIIIFFAIVTSSTHYISKPIYCWAPAELKDHMVDYVNSYCWVKNTYFAAFEDILPEGVEERIEQEITYYQWTPLILLFMAFLFKFPNFVWKLLHPYSGLHFNKIITIADECLDANEKDRKNKMRNIGYFMNKWLNSMQQYDRNVLGRARATVSRLFCYFGNKREGKFLTSLYIVTKLLYVINVIGQFFLLNEFLGMAFSSLGLGGWDESYLARGIESPRFPRVTMCDFQIRLLQNVQRYTVQCVLPMNLFNEKIFLILWTWMIILAILSGINLIQWFYLLVLKRNNYMYVKKFLKTAVSSKVRFQKETDKASCREFVDSYLRDDGCFVLRMIALNSTDMAVGQVVETLWRHHRGDKTAFDDEEDEEKKKKDKDNEKMTNNGPV